MKRILSAILALLMLAGAFSVAIGATEWVYEEGFTVGNADGDEAGTVNAKDLNLMKSYMIGDAGAIAALDMECADLSVDNKINTNDVFFLKKLLLGEATKEELRDNVQTAKLEIAGNDITEYALVVPTGHGDNKNTYYSADQLRKYIKVATGVNLTIVNDGSWTGKAITFTQYELDSEMGQLLGTEGYKYSIDTDGNLNIHGTYRGCIYAVWEILENYLGVRFYEDTFFYKQRYVNIPSDIDVTHIPALKFRFCGGIKGNDPATYYYPARNNGTQIYGWADEKYGYQYGPQNINAHSYDLFWQYGTGTMPEDDGTMTIEQRYLACLESGETHNNLGWQPCATSEDSYNTLFKGLIMHTQRLESWGSSSYAFTGVAKNLVEQGQKSMSFSLCDNEKYCTCRYCKNKANGWTDRTQKPPVKYPAEGYGATYLDMANRAARDIQEYYPGMRIHCILYNHDIPATIKPDKNVIVWFCGQGCNNHFLGTEECGDCTGQLGRPNNGQLTNESLKVWGSLCAETGAEMWFWSYGVQYHYTLTSLPYIINIYYDYKYLYEECNVRGIYYENGGSDYNFRNVKAYLSTKMAWDPEMTLEEFIAYYKEYLYMYYGDGYEYVYEFLCMMETSGDQCGTCFISNFDHPGDMYSYDYLAENYEYMRGLLQTAYDMADGKTAEDKASRQYRIKTMMICFEFLGLSSVHTDWYLEGDAESKALYEERYTAFYNDMAAYGLKVTSDNSETLPDTIDFEENPMIQFYGIFSRRPDVKP